MGSDGRNTLFSLSACIRSIMDTKIKKNRIKVESN